MHHFLKISLCTVGILLFAATAQAEPGTSYETTVSGFFERLEAGKSNDALDYLYGSSPWMARAADAIQQVKTQFKDLSSLVGDYRGKELVASKSLSDRLVYLNYLVLYDRQPVRFEFQFYRPQDKWLTYSFSFDDNLDDDLAEQGRIEAVRE